MLCGNCSSENVCRAARTWGCGKKSSKEKIESKWPCPRIVICLRQVVGWFEHFQGHQKRGSNLNRCRIVDQLIEYPHHSKWLRSALVKSHGMGQGMLCTSKHPTPQLWSYDSYGIPRVRLKALKWLRIWGICLSARSWEDVGALGSRKHCWTSRWQNNCLLHVFANVSKIS